MMSTKQALLQTFLILAACLYSLACSSGKRDADPSVSNNQGLNPSQNTTSVGPFQDRQKSDREVEVAGLVRKVELRATADLTEEKGQMIVQLHTEKSEKGAEVRVSFNARTRLVDEEEKVVSAKAVKAEADQGVAQAVRVVGKIVDENALEARKITFLVACDCTVCGLCPREQCNRKCGAGSCTCPAN